MISSGEAVCRAPPLQWERHGLVWLGSCFVFFNIPNGFIKCFFETCLMPLQIGELCQITFVEPQSLTYCIIIHKLYNYKLYILDVSWCEKSMINQSIRGLFLFTVTISGLPWGVSGVISSLPHSLKALGAPDCGDFPSSQCGFPVWPRQNSACFDKNSGWSGLIQPLTFKFCLQFIPRFTFRSFWSWQLVFGFLWDPSLTTFFNGYMVISSLLHHGHHGMFEFQSQVHTQEKNNGHSIYMGSCLKSFQPKECTYLK